MILYDLYCFILEVFYMVKITFKTDLCKGCGLCVTACRKHLLQMSKEKINAKGHHPVEITDESACIGCANCATMCPDCVITVEK
jgi:2-oxoglutarate ferredoxin oxidoreductase subunit delta